VDTITIMDTDTPMRVMIAMTAIPYGQKIETAEKRGVVFAGVALPGDLDHGFWGGPIANRLAWTTDELGAHPDGLALLRPGAAFYWMIGYRDLGSRQRVRESVIWMRRSGRMGQDKFRAALDHVETIWSDLTEQGTILHSKHPEISASCGPIATSPGSFLGLLAEAENRTTRVLPNRTTRLLSTKVGRDSDSEPG
jgi:hypothetical protein